MGELEAYSGKEIMTTVSFEHYDHFHSDVYGPEGVLDRKVRRSSASALPWAQTASRARNTHSGYHGN